MMFEHNPFGLAILWTCLRAYKASESILDDFCSFWSIYPPNKQKMAPKFHFLEHKNAFLCNLQNMQSVVRQNHFLSSKSIKIKSKTFLRLRKLFQNVLRMFLKHKGKNYFLVKKIFSKIFFDLKKFEFYNTLPISSDVVIQGNFKRP